MCYAPREPSHANAKENTFPVFYPYLCIIRGYRCRTHVYFSAPWNSLEVSVATVQRIPIAREVRFLSRTKHIEIVTRRSRCNYGNSHPRNVASSRAAPAVLALLVPHRLCVSISLSFSFSVSSASSDSFLLRSRSPLSLSRSSLPLLLRFNYLSVPHRSPPLALSLVLGHCLLLGPFIPFPLVHEAMHLRRTLTSSLRLSSCSAAERALTPVPDSRPALPVAVFFVLFLYFYFFLFLRRQE